MPLTLYQLKQEIQWYIDNNYTTELNQIAPILARYIRISNGLEITGTFSTNDGTAEGRPFYITTLRQNGKPAVHDGFGFVVIKGNDETTREKYNVFIVDHNIMIGDFTFGNFLQVPNINSYMTGGVGVVTAGKAIIEPDLEYNFRLQINENWATDLRIWKTGEDYTGVTWETMPDGPLKSGAMVDGPLAYGGRQIQSPLTGAFIDLPKGTDLGFAVDNPSGYKWFIKDVQIRKFSGGIPTQLFEFSNNNIIEGPVQVNYYGYSEYEVSSVLTVGEVDVFIARVDSPDGAPTEQNFDSWEKVGTTNVYGTIHRLRTATPDAAKYYSIGGKFYIALTNDFESISNIDLNTASIKTDYIEVTRAQNRPIVDRSALDLWVDPINILQKTTSGSVYLESGGITTIDTGITHPIFYIEKVYNVLSPTVNLLDTGEVTVYNTLDGLIYSSRDMLRLSHPELPGGIEIKVDYWNTGADGTQIQNFLADNKYRGPAQDLLLRVVPPTIFKITSLSYQGSQTLTEVKDEIINYVLGLGTTGTLRKSDILSVLYSLGIARIVLSTLEMQIVIYDYIEGWYESFILSEEYTRTETPGRWYTNTDLLNITKL